MTDTQFLCARSSPSPQQGARKSAGASPAEHSRTPLALEPAAARPGFFMHVDTARAALKKRDMVGAKASTLYAAQAAYQSGGDTANPFDAVTEAELHADWAWMWGVMDKAAMERTGRLPLRDISPAYAELMGGGA